jgi:hypothetical protein
MRVTFFLLIYPNITKWQVDGSSHTDFFVYLSRYQYLMYKAFEESTRLKRRGIIINLH